MSYLQIFNPIDVLVNEGILLTLDCLSDDLLITSQLSEVQLAMLIELVLHLQVEVPL